MYSHIRRETGANARKGKTKWQWAMGYGLWAIGYGLWAMGYGLWAMGNKRIKEKGESEKGEKGKDKLAMGDGLWAMGDGLSGHLVLCMNSLWDPTLPLSSSASPLVLCIGRLGSTNSDLSVRQNDERTTPLTCILSLKDPPQMFLSLTI